MFIPNCFETASLKGLRILKDPFKEYVSKGLWDVVTAEKEKKKHVLLHKILSSFWFVFHFHLWNTQMKQLKRVGQPYWPVLDLVGALHRVNVHTDLVLDVRGYTCGPGIHVHEDHAGPKLVLLQQVQGLMGHLGLIRVSHKLIQVYALWPEEKRALQLDCRYVFMYYECSLKLVWGHWYHDGFDFPELKTFQRFYLKFIHGFLHFVNSNLLTS